MSDTWHSRFRGKNRAEPILSQLSEIYCTSNK